MIIPVYNRERTVRRALDSVRAQTWRPIELVVVDDGSRDRSAETVREWISDQPVEDEFQVTLIEQANAGGSAARNRGIRETTGDLLQFLDSDDWLDPEKVRLQAELLTKNPELGFVYGPVGNPDDERGFLFAHRAMGIQELKLRQIRHPFLTTPGPLIRRSVFDLIGLWDERLPCSQDWELHSRMAMYEIPFEFVPESRVYLGSDAHSVESRVSRFGEEREQTEQWFMARMSHLNSIYAASSPANAADKKLRCMVAWQMLHVISLARLRGIDPLNDYYQRILLELTAGTIFSLPLRLLVTLPPAASSRASLSLDWIYWRIAGLRNRLRRLFTK